MFCNVLIYSDFKLSKPKTVPDLANIFPIIFHCLDRKLIVVFTMKNCRSTKYNVYNIKYTIIKLGLLTTFCFDINVKFHFPVTNYLDVDFMI